MRVLGLLAVSQYTYPEMKTYADVTKVLLASPSKHWIAVTTGKEVCNKQKVLYSYV